MIIRLAGVTKYYGGHRALDHLTAEVRPGVIGLLGPNGAGKSTLIKSLLGLVRLSSGEASVLGHDVRTDSRAVREETGYMPEDDCTIPGMVGVQSVAYSGELGGLPARTALRRAHEILDYVGLAEERYRELQTYSTGMRQKAKLAQALIHGPKLVFLDEPTSGLDPQGRDRMLQLIRGMYHKKGVSVVVSTHILHDVEACCDAVLIVARGRLVVYDDLKNLRKSVDSSFVVRFSGEREPFLKALQAAGCAPTPAGPEELKVTGDGELSARIFRAAQDSGAAVRQLAPSRTSLEEIFLGAVTGGGKDAHL